jgi:hypothetical protein
LSSRKEEQDQDRQRARTCQDVAPGRLKIRPPAKRQPSGVNLSSLSGCLFPREQEVTGKNPTAPPASLTGRIWFFCRTNCEPLLINETPTESRLLSPLSRSAPSQRPTDCRYEPHSAAPNGREIPSSVTSPWSRLRRPAAYGGARLASGRLRQRAHSPREALLQRPAQLTG